MTFALLYCRVDGEGVEARAASLDLQERMLIEDARRRGFEYKVIREDVSQGDGEPRDRLAEALDLLDQHHADVLMAARLDRLGGSPESRSTVLHRASARGWGLIIAGESVGPGAVSPRFQEHLDELAASRLRSERTREGIERRRREGAVFGRVVADGFLPTYRRVVGMSEDGMSMNEIARRLNNEGVPTARGGDWHASTVRAILSSDTARKLA